MLSGRVGETATPTAAALGRPERIDDENIRNGATSLFLVVEPLLGWRAVQVTGRRTARNFAKVACWLAEEVHEEADKVVLVQDNLNTHKIASLYEAFPPEQARRIVRKREAHHTSKHGSWLNVPEIELAVLSRQCLDRRIGTRPEWERGGAPPGKKPAFLMRTSARWRTSGSRPIRSNGERTE